MEVVASNYGNNPAVNAFIKIGAESFPNIPFEELYDLENDPYQKNNLIKPQKSMMQLEDVQMKVLIVKKLR